MKRIAAPLCLALLAFIFFNACTEKEIQTKKPVVDAGAPVSMKVSADSVQLTATITEENGTITEYLWRKISGAGSPEIVTPNSPSTWVKNLVEGVYAFQIMVKNEKGDIGTDTVSVEVLPADTITFNLAPANNKTEVHLFGNATIDQTDTIAPELLGGSGTYYGDPVNIRALLRFDLSGIPAGARILSAKLSLFSNPTPLNGIDGNPNYGTDNTLLIQRVTTPWEYQAVKWLNQPEASTSDEIEIPHTNEPSLDLLDIDVTGMIPGILAEGNNGFLIRLKTEATYNFRIFCSSKYSDPTKHPKLNVVYTTTPE
jgi:hypothetical protein